MKFDVSENLEAHIEKKTAKLDRFFEEIVSVDVYLKVVKPETAQNKEVQIKIVVPNAELFATKTCDTFEEAVDSSLEALERQLKKHKEKISKKK